MAGNETQFSGTQRTHGALGMWKAQEQSWATLENQADVLCWPVASLAVPYSVGRRELVPKGRIVSVQYPSRILLMRSRVGPFPNGPLLLKGRVSVHTISESFHSPRSSGRPPRLSSKSGLMSLTGETTWGSRLSSSGVADGLVLAHCELKACRLVG